MAGGPVNLYFNFIQPFIQAAHLSVALRDLGHSRGMEDYHRRLVFQYEDQMRSLRQEVFNARRMAVDEIMRNRIQALRDEDQTLRNEHQTLINEEQTLRNEVQALRGELDRIQTPRDEPGTAPRD